MRRVLALTAVVVLVLSGVAEAHARLDKKSVKAGSIQALSVRVPGEEADAGTTKVVLEIPAGFTAAGCKEKAGWTCAITPDTTNGRNGLVTWTGSSKPKAVDFFAFTVRVPNKNGTYAFQVNQTYSDGDVAHWDQRPGEDHPAPLLEVSGAVAVADTAPPVDHTVAPAAPAPTATVTPAAVPDDDGPGALPVVLVAVLLVGAGGAFLARGRLRR